MTLLNSINAYTYNPVNGKLFCHVVALVGKRYTVTKSNNVANASGCVSILCGMFVDDMTILYTLDQRTAERRSGDVISFYDCPRDCNNTV